MNFERISNSIFFTEHFRATASDHFHYKIILKSISQLFNQLLVRWNSTITCRYSLLIYMAWCLDETVTYLHSVFRQTFEWASSYIVRPHFIHNTLSCCRELFTLSMALLRTNNLSTSPSTHGCHLSVKVAKRCYAANLSFVIPLIMLNRNAFWPNKLFMLP